MNNYERIKSMGIDEMAEFLSDVIFCESCPVLEVCADDTTCNECQEKFQQWLKLESEE